MHKVLLALYHVLHTNVKCKKLHIIGEDLVLDIVSTLFDESMAQQLKTISLSNDTVHQQISDISEDFNEKLIEELQDNQYTLQVNEATDIFKRISFNSLYLILDADKIMKELISFTTPQYVH